MKGLHRVAVASAGVFAMAASFLYVAHAQSALVITAGPGVAASETTEDSAVVRWTTSEAASTYVHYGTTSALGSTQRKIVIVPGEPEQNAYEISHSLELRELSAGTTYFYQAESTTEDGRQARSSIQQFTTKTATAPPLTGVHVTAPAAGQTVSAPFTFTARTDGPAAALNFIIKTSAGGEVAKVGATSTDGGYQHWSSGLASMPDGQLTVTAEAVGKDPAGATVSLFDTVAFTSHEACEQDDWACTEWGICTSAGIQARSCMLEDDCPFAATPKPAESQGCTAPCTRDDWSCTAWSACSGAGTQTRTCTLRVDCPTATTAKPAESQRCTPPTAAPECTRDEWRCGEWGICVDGKQKRTCDLRFDCPNVETSKPATEQLCRFDNGVTGEMLNANVNAEFALPPPPEQVGASVAILQETFDAAGVEHVRLTSDTGPGYDPNDPIQPDYRVTFIGVKPDDQLELAAECRANGIDGDRCAVWLESRYQDGRCAAQGIFTVARCEALLVNLNAGVFPGCEGKTPEECDAIRARALLGYLPSSLHDVLNNAMTTKPAGQVLAALGDAAPSLVAVRPEVAAKVRWIPSAPVEGTETSPGIIVLDADKDGLTDDFEMLFGTNPLEKDSDGDLISDLDESKAGTNPTGEGPLTIKFDATALALVNLVPLQQPLAVGEIDETFSITSSVKDQQIFEGYYSTPDANEPLRDINDPALGIGNVDLNEPTILDANAPPEDYDVNSALGPGAGDELRRPTILPYSGQLSENGELVNGMMTGVQYGDSGMITAYQTGGYKINNVTYSDAGLVTGYEYTDGTGTHAVTGVTYGLDERIQTFTLDGRPEAREGRDADRPRIEESLFIASDFLNAVNQTEPAQIPNVLSGQATPNSTVLVFIYSYVPVVMAAQTDADGNFNIDLSDGALNDGEHEVYVAVTDETGKITKKGNPLSFFVKEAQAVTAEEFDAPDFQPTATEPAREWQAYYLAGVAALMLMALAVVWGFAAKFASGEGLKPPGAASAK